MLLFAFMTLAHAKDLRNHVGVGVDTALGHGVSTVTGTSAAIPALSLRFGLPASSPNVNVQIELDGGFNAGGGEEARYLAGGRVLYGVVVEDNMNLYLGAGAGYLGQGSTGRVRIQPTMSAQWFFFGLENLGFSAECGVSIDAGGSQGARAVTVGGVPAVGLHYYF